MYNKNILVVSEHVILLAYTSFFFCSFLFLGMGVRLSPLGISATLWPTEPTLYDVR
jgi:hypothetical protein